MFSSRAVIERFGPLSAFALGLGLMAACTASPGAGSAPPSVVSAAPSAFPTSVQVNGNALRLDCRGSGSPTIILETGTDDPIDLMSPVQARLQLTHLTCAYERAKSAGLRTAAEANKDLHDLVAAAAIPGPYVLVGQSLGGDLVQLYARTYPDNLVGVVSMSSGPPCGPWLAALPSLDNPQLLADETANCADNHGRRDRYDGNAYWAEMQAAPAPPDIPFELVISTVDGDWCPPGQSSWAPFASLEQCEAAWAIGEGIARDLVKAWPNGHLTELKARHAMWFDDLDGVLNLIEGVAGRAPA